MGGLKKRYKAACRTVITVSEALELLVERKDTESYDVVRDSVIKRFEYTLDTFWKFFTGYMQEECAYEFDNISPRETIRGIYTQGLIDEVECDILLACVTARNRSAHAYNEEMADGLIKKIPTFNKTMQTILSRVELSE